MKVAWAAWDQGTSMETEVSALQCAMSQSTVLWFLQVWKERAWLAEFTSILQMFGGMSFPPPGRLVMCRSPKTPFSAENFLVFVGLLLIRPLAKFS